MILTQMLSSSRWIFETVVRPNPPINVQEQPIGSTYGCPFPIFHDEPTANLVLKKTSSS
jgi:hypothetical protein